jgi:H3 lysine-79-specific histone-lysine N-methyltransferase
VKSTRNFAVSKGEEICIQYDKDISGHFPKCFCSNCNSKWLETQIDWKYVLGGNDFKKASAFSNETYGEIKPILVSKVIQHLSITSEDVFYDLGSGIGNVVMQVSMETGCRAIGIEKVMSRHTAALRLLEQCGKFEPMLAERVNLYHQDLTQLTADLSDATIVFTSNWCFDQDLHRHLLDHFSVLSKGTTIICTKDLLGQRNSDNSRKRNIATTFLQQRESIKGPLNGVSWTSSHIECFIYVKE